MSAAARWKLTSGDGIHGAGDTTSSKGESILSLAKTSRTTESFSQFAKIDSGFWAWDFYLKDESDRECRLE